LKGFLSGMWGSTASRKRSREGEGPSGPSGSRKQRLSVAVDEVEAALLRLREVTTQGNLTETSRESSSPDFRPDFEMGHTRNFRPADLERSESGYDGAEESVEETEMQYEVKQESEEESNVSGYIDDGYRPDMRRRNAIWQRDPRDYLSWQELEDKLNRADYRRDDLEHSEVSDELDENELRDCSVDYGSETCDYTDEEAPPDGKIVYSTPDITNTISSLASPHDKSSTTQQTVSSISPELSPVFETPDPPISPDTAQSYYPSPTDASPSNGTTTPNINPTVSPSTRIKQESPPHTPYTSNPLKSPLFRRTPFAAERFPDYITPRSPARQARLVKEQRYMNVSPHGSASSSSDEIYLPSFGRMSTSPRRAGVSDVDVIHWGDGVIRMERVGNKKGVGGRMQEGGRMERDGSHES
jgi:hypothetical protein